MKVRAENLSGGPPSRHCDRLVLEAENAVEGAWLAALDSTLKLGGNLIIQPNDREAISVDFEGGPRRRKGSRR